jgi:hypothetical protein
MTPLENLRHNITLRDGVDLDGTLTELLDYLKVLEARVEALESQVEELESQVEPRIQYLKHA